MQGLHLIADLYDCQAPTELMFDAARLEAYCVNACRRHELTVVGQLFHAFCDEHGQSAGVTGTVVLAESHLAIHTWPEIGAVTLDIYVCNYSCDNSLRAEALFTEVTEKFSPKRIERNAVQRGQLESARA